MRDNVLTNSMKRLTSMLVKTDSKLQDMGKTPYATRKSTPDEQRAMYDSLTSDKLITLIQENGLEKVNAFLGRFEEEGKGIG